MDASPAREIRTFIQFYELYVLEHQSRAFRIVHLIGMSIQTGCIILWVVNGSPWILLTALATGIGASWAGRLLYGSRTSRAFAHPVYAFLGDWRLFWELLSFQRRL
jgi:hypothetical protein